MSALAGMLKAHPKLDILLVGHTDNQGAMDRNLVLSRQRAAAVRDRLTNEFGINPRRIEIAGAGYLVPQTSNATAAGKEANRRVEVVLMSQ